MRDGKWAGTTRARRTRTEARVADDRGSVLLLILGMTALALALIVAVLDVTSLYLERKRLFTLADGAALVAAQSYDITLAPLLPDPTASTPQLVRPRLSTVSVWTGAHDYLLHVPDTGLHGATMKGAHTLDGKTATVVMQTRWRPPVIDVFLPRGILIEVAASARVIS